MDRKYKIFVINAGSTSMKSALFENDREVYSVKTNHDHEELQAVRDMKELVAHFKAALLAELDRRDLSLAGTEAFVGRGLGLAGCAAGTYDINDAMLDKVRSNPGMRPHMVASQLAHELSLIYGGRAFVVDPEDIDELETVARVTGLADVPRQAKDHPLNQKAVARRFAAEGGTRYEDINVVVAHMGGGISVSAHRKGRIIDTSDAAQGDGPMAPNRCGAIPVAAIIRKCFSGVYTEDQMNELVRRSGGLMDHLGTDNVLHIMEWIKNGDEYAKLVFDAMIYQIAKSIGAYAVVLKGEVDGILLTGGMAFNDVLVREITEMVRFIAPVKVYAGEFELEAMAAGALRVLTGQEDAREYTGLPVWGGHKR
jgi:butyrate kinase